jgi:AcrR family transcriptional regulator
VTDDTLTRVETACAELTQRGEPVTFTAVAQRAGVGRATLYRRPELRAVVEEHRAHSRDAHTLSGLATEIRQLRTAVEAIADNVRRHDETLRRLTRDDSR